jgi:succinate-semialdehyde dehydrogenase / glutarate-semialdehyde dehydrogenase
MPFQTVDPSSGLVTATFQAHSSEEVEVKLAQAAATFADYRTTSFSERARLLVTAAELLEGELPDVAQTLTAEMGKTFAAAKGEVAKCAMAMRWFAEHAESLLADEVISTKAQKSYVHYQPLGPVLAIMPWNFPLWQVVRFAAPGLMAGNVGLLKHAPNVPQTALLLEDLFRRAGYPKGAFTNLFVETADVEAIIADPRVAAVTLTGSERAGISVAEIAGRNLKKCVLELGGSDPFIVLASADIEKTVRTAIDARVQNNGQSCIAAKRFIVVDEVADEFTERFAEAMAALRVGDPFEPSTEIGPIANESQRDLLVAQVDDARQKGATVHCGGAALDQAGWYFSPTVLSGVVPGMRVATEEVFGPVAMVERVADLDEAITVANATVYGLGSSCWTNDVGEQHRCIEELEAGAVFVNAMVASSPDMPFGGIKRSGYGRELSELGIKEFCNAKSVWVA